MYKVRNVRSAHSVDHNASNSIIEMQAKCNVNKYFFTVDWGKIGLRKGIFKLIKRNINLAKEGCKHKMDKLRIWGKGAWGMLYFQINKKQVLSVKLPPDGMRQLLKGYLWSSSQSSYSQKKKIIM